MVEESSEWIEVDEDEGLEEIWFLEERLKARQGQGKKKTKEKGQFKRTIQLSSQWMNEV